MNKRLFRIVFNRALGQLQVVSDIAQRQRGRSAAGSGTTSTVVRRMNFSLWLALGMVSYASLATAGQITTDPSAPGSQRPVVLGSPGAAPLVNITTPSAAGVSRNTYLQFYIDRNGVVLNNARNGATTQLAGTIPGNPNLATGTAKIILNEVTGPNPTQLGGYVEVGGDKAQVIIASPAGIACDGCGFLNASRATLTTGVPQLTNGRLDGYRVTGGTIVINDQGLDASQADYTDIIARAVQLNGSVWAKQLQVTMGASQVSADQSTITPIAGSGPAPAFALDSSALGGMYANKIVLLANEQGVGVRNAGAIGASVGQVAVTVDGRLENTGAIQSKNGDTMINASGGVVNAGTLSAINSLLIQTPRDVDNSHGTLSAGRIEVDAGSLRNANGTITQTGAQGMSLQADTLLNGNGGTIGAPVAATEPSAGGVPSTPSAGSSPSSDNVGAMSGGGPGTAPAAPLADGLLNIAGALDNSAGHITANAGFGLRSANGLNNDGGQLELRQLALSGGDLSNRNGTLTIDGTASIQGNDVINDGGQLAFAHAVALSVWSLSNRYGLLMQADTAPATLSVANVFDNTGGKLQSNAAMLTLNSGTFVNETGVLSHAGTQGLALNVQSWRGAMGTVVTAGDAAVHAGNIDHRGATLTAAQIRLTADSLDNQGGMIAASGAQANSLTVNGLLDNGAKGTIVSNADLSITASRLGNADGAIQHAGSGTLGIHATTLAGAGGAIESNGHLDLNGTAIDLSNGTTSAQSMAITTDALSTASGTLTAQGTDALVVHASGTWNNDSGSVAANGAMQVKASSLSNTHGSLTATGAEASTVQVNGTLDNTGGLLAANGPTSVHANTLLNEGGTVQSASGSLLSVTADALLDNSTHGQITTDGDLSIKATTLANQQGAITHAGIGTLAIQAGTLSGAGGSIDSNGVLQLEGGQLDLSGGTTAAQTISLSASALNTANGFLQAIGSRSLSVQVSGAWNNDKGQVATNGALRLAAQSLSNVGGSVTAAGSAASTVTVNGALNNANGLLAAAGASTVHAGSLTNKGGTVQSVNGSSLTLTVDGLLDNSMQGKLTSDGDLLMSAGMLDNQQGTVAHAGHGTLGIQATTLNGHGGTIGSNGALTLSGGQFDLGGGTTTAQSVDITADALSTANGSLQAAGNAPLSVTVNGAWDNAAGTVASNGALQIYAQSLSNAYGKVTATGTDGSTVQVGRTLDNTAGTFATLHALSVSVGGLVNEGGTIQNTNGSPLALSVDGLLDNSGHGTLTSDGDLSISASTFNNSLGSVAHAGTGTLRIDAATLNGADGTIGSNGQLLLTGGQVDLSGGTTTAQAINLVASTLKTANASLQAAGNSPLSVKVNGAWDNTAGTVASNGALDLTAGTLTNAHGSMTAANTGASIVQVTNAFDNTAGTLATLHALSAHAGSLVNQGGTLQSSSGAPLALAVDGLLDNSAHGTLASDGDVSVVATTLNNSLGTIAQAGNGTLSIHATTLNGVGGTIASNGALQLGGNQVNLDGGTTSAQTIDINADALSTANGSLQAIGDAPLAVQLTGQWDNTAGIVATNGALRVGAASLINVGGHLTAAGADPSQLQLTGTLDNTNGVLGTAGATTLMVGGLANQGGLIQAQSSNPLTVHVTDALVNDQGRLQSNGAMDLIAASLRNQGGTIQTPQGLSATITGTLDDTGGSMLAGGDIDLTAMTLLNRNTTATQGVHGQAVTLNVSTLDNSAGAIQANSALTVNGGAVVNAGGTLDGQTSVTITGTSLNNTGGKVIQRGDTGTLSMYLTQALSNTGGLIGAEGSAQLAAASIDNSGGTAYARHDLVLRSQGGEVLNRNGGLLQTGGNLTLTSAGGVDNSGGQIDATGAARVTGATITNNGGSMLAGSSDNPGAALTLTSTGAISNIGGTIGNRGGDATVDATSLDNSSNGSLVAQHDLQLNLGGLNNASGTAYATNNLTFQNANATLDNTGGQFGAGQTATLTLASLINDRGHIKANTLLLDPPAVSNESGTIAANVAQIEVGSLTGIGTIQGTQSLDLHITGDYTYLIGQQMKSDGTLGLTVDGTFTNQGTLQTQGTLNLAAHDLINAAGGVINASRADGSGHANVTISGSLDNQAGADLEGDTLVIHAGSLTNTGSISGNGVDVTATTVTNGRDIGNTIPATDYAQGFIGAASSLTFHIGQSLTNIDAELYSAGDLSIGGAAAGTNVPTLLNSSGRIEADGNITIAADSLTNTRRILPTVSGVQTVSIDLDPTIISGSGPNGPLVPMYCLSAPGGTCYVQDASVWIEHTVIQQDSITGGSAAGLITAGGNIGITTNSLLNRVSTIAAGNNLTVNGGVASTDANGTLVNGSAATITNEAISGSQTVQSQQVTRTIHDTPSDCYQQGPVKPCEPENVETYGTATTATQTGVVMGSYLTAGNAVSITGGNITNSAVGAAGGGGNLDVHGLNGPGSTGLGTTSSTQAGTVSGVAGAHGQAVNGTSSVAGANGQTVNGAGGPAGANGATISGSGSVTGARGSVANGAAGVSGTQGQVVGTIDHPLPGLVPPSSGRYTNNLSPNAPFLVVTSPRFATGSQVSSNYLLQALNTDPSNIQKRLGDGYYEQNLVEDQILQLTGRRTLNGTGDAAGQYQVLMTNAANQAQALGLTLGAPLTSSQIASLTSDITWLVDEVVDGHHVLVPVVYLAKGTADQLETDGALIAGTTVNIHAAGTVTNDGMLTGSQGTTILADRLINTGAISGAQQLAIATKGDLTNQGTLSGGDVNLFAGGNLTSTSLMPEWTGSKVMAGSNAITATGNLTIQSLGNVTLQNSGISAAGNVIIDALGDLNFLAQSSSYAIGKPQQWTATQGAVVSSVQAGGTLAMSAGGTLYSQGGQFSSGQGMAVQAGNILLDDVTTERRSYLGSENRTADQVNVTGSRFTSGGDLSMVAQQDITAVSANLKAAGNTTLVAGDQINLLADSNTTQLSDDYKVGHKHITDNVETSTAQGTQISTGGSLALVSNGDQTYQAANLSSGSGTAIISGGTVNFDTAANIDNESHTSKSKTWYHQSMSNVGVESTTNVQTSITGPLSIAAAQGVNVQFGQLAGESQDAALARMEANPGQSWLSQVSGPNVNWISEADVNKRWNQHQSGMGTELAAVVTIAAVALTAGAASAAVGTMAGATAGSGTAMAAAGTGAAAGWGNALVTGAILGAEGGGLNAGLQGQNIAKGALHGAEQGLISAGAFYAAGQFTTASSAGGWGGDTTYASGSWQKVLVHGIAGGTSNAVMGGNFADGFISAGVAERGSTYTSEYLSSNAATQALGQAGIGAASAWLTGGNVADGAINGAAGYLFNRAMHPEETSALAKLQANQTPDEQQRLADAACALIRCADGVPDNDPNKAQLVASQQRGQTNTAEQNQLLATGQFGYGTLDTVKDWSSSNQVFPRVLGGLQWVGGNAQVFGAGVTASTCETGFGCAAALWLGGTGVDNASAGYLTMINGSAAPTWGAQVLQGFGLSPTASGLVYGGLQLAPTAYEAYAANQAIDAWAAANANARITYSIPNSGIASASTDAEAGGASAYAGQYNLAGKITGQYDMVTNPGPLAEIPGVPAGNFATGQYTAVQLSDDVTLYRAGDAGGKALGQWYTTKPPTSVASVRIDSAVKPQWINSDGVLEGESPINSYFKIQIPSGTTVYTGPVGYQGGVYLGGESTNQIFVSQPWTNPAVQVIGKPIPLQ